MASRKRRAPRKSKSVQDDRAGPKTTRPSATERREPQPRTTAAEKIKRTLFTNEDDRAGADWLKKLRSDSHDGFDNDEATMNSVLFRMLRKAPKRPFTVRDLRFE